MRRDFRARPPDVSRILPNLLVGEYPRVDDIAWLKSAQGVTAVLSLQHESDLWDKGVTLSSLHQEYRRHSIEFRHVPIEDYSEDDLALTLERAVAELHELLAAEHQVLLHCNAGYNRAPTIAIAYLCAHHRLPLAAAIDLVKAKRPCVPYASLLRRIYP